MSSLSSLVLVLIFVVAGAAIVAAGIRLANSTDALDTRLGLGSALGGLILLAFATNLPELAITVTAAIAGNLGLAVGNLVGGIAVQTVVLVALDAAGDPERPMSYLAGSLVLMLEAVLVVSVLIVGIMSTRLPTSVNVAGASPGSIAIVAVWIGGLLVIRRAQRGLPWHVDAPEARPGRTRQDKRAGKDPQPMKGHSTVRVALVFAAAAAVTLAAGIAIEESGSELAGRIGLSGAVFGATILAATTALPEIATGLQSVRIGDNNLAFSDIFGGNAFLMVLFLVADLIAGRPALPGMHDSDLWMAGLGVVVTVAYLVGVLMRSRRTIARIGPDSVAVLALYALGIVGLVVIGS